MDEYSQIDTHSKNVISANVNVHHPHQLTIHGWGGERDEGYTFTVGGIIMKIAQVLVFKHKKPAINGLQKLECLDV